MGKIRIGQDKPREFTPGRPSVPVVASQATESVVAAEEVVEGDVAPVAEVEVKNPAPKRGGRRSKRK